MRTTTFLVLLFLVVMLGAGTTRGSSYVVDCSGGGDFLAIQEAVDAAASGDTIFVAPCLYEEQVVVSGKCLTFVGAGAGSCVVAPSGGEPALSIDAMPSPWVCRVTGLTIDQGAGESDAIRWDSAHLVLSECAVIGVMSGGNHEYQTSASARLANSELGLVSVYGWNRPSLVESCVVAGASFSGDDFSPPHELLSTDSAFGEFDITLVDATVNGGQIGRAFVFGSGSALLEHCRIGELVLYSSCELRLQQCVLDSVNWWGSCHPYYPLEMERCLVNGNISMRYQTSGAFKLEHNTILGSFLYSGDGTHGTYHHLRSNVVLGNCTIDAGYGDVNVTHNDVLGELDVSASGSVHANFSADPLFCGASSSDYTLEDCSPCVGAAHDGTDVGAYPVGCPCVVAAERTTWGALKALYR